MLQTQKVPEMTNILLNGIGMLVSPHSPLRLYFVY